MSLTNDLVRLANSANVLATAISVNSTAITALNVGGYTINTTGMSVNSTSTNTFTIGTSSYFVANGNVGIGTSSPSTKLQLGTGSTNETITVKGTVADATFGNDATGVLIGTVNNAPIRFTTNAAERMRIDSSGNVGIGGTTTINSKLTIKNPNVSGEQVIFNIQGATSTGTFAKISYNQTDDSLLFFNQSSYAGSYFALGTSNTERLRIDVNGNVGIGTTLPAAKLDINGTTYHQGNVILGSSSVAVGLQANSSYGTAGQVLTSNGTATYWSTTIGKTIAMAIVFGG
jgi:hypothetical protein